MTQSKIQSTKQSYESFDHDHFNYLTWSNSSEPQTVIIAVHGINGAASDYDNLANYILNHQKDLTIYAPETRGQGNDLNLKRIGDIYRKEEWFKDLDAFSLLARSLHPSAEIIWCGESMGSLIVTHCYAQKIYFRPDRIILLAPVVSLRPHLSVWKHKLANLISYLLPRFRVPLTQFSGDQAVKVTQTGDNHEEQASTNSYYINKFTLRLLANLGNLVNNMNSSATKLDCPVLVLNGGLDYFTPPEYAELFYAEIPKSKTNRHAYFADSYHLLMYDAHQNLVFEEIIKWIKPPAQM